MEQLNALISAVLVAVEQQAWLPAFFKQPLAYALHRFAYYQCARCALPYYGGEAACGAAPGAFNPADLVCAACLPHAADADCPKHGREYIVHKCKYCCAEALYFCFGTTHFCERCHDDPSKMQELEASGRLPKCPAGPLGKQLPPGAACAINGAHADPGCEQTLGCSVCRNAATF